MSASMRQDLISHVHELARSKLVSIYTLGTLFLVGLLGISLRGERRPIIYNLNSKVASMEGWEYVTPDRLHTTDVNFPPVSTKYAEPQGLELPQSNTPETWTPDWYNQTDIQALLQRRSERVRWVYLCLIGSVRPVNQYIYQCGIVTYACYASVQSFYVSASNYAV